MVNLKFIDVHILIKRALSCNTFVCGSRFSSFLLCTFENEKPQIVGPALIDTIVLFKVHLNNSYYTGCQIIEKSVQCFLVTLPCCYFIHNYILWGFTVEI